MAISKCIAFVIACALVACGGATEPPPEVAAGAPDAPACELLLRHTSDGNAYAYACPEGVEPPCSPASLVDGLFVCGAP
jgi:hypothetical protein